MSSTSIIDFEAGTAFWQSL